MRRGIIFLLVLFFGISNTGITFASISEPSATLTQAPVESSESSSEEDLDGPDLIRKQIEEAPNPLVLGITDEDENSTPSPVLTNEEVAPSAQISSPPLIRRLAKKTFLANEEVEVVVDNVKSEKVTVKLFYNGAQVDNFEDFVEDTGTRKIAVIKPRAHFKPGKYSVEVTVGNQTLKQDFNWGVLAINTNKAIYSPNETVKIAMAVLDEGGRMVCEAKVELRIKNHESREETLSTENGRITSNPDCLKREVRQKPDYEANYKLGSQTGKYELTLIAQTKNGTYSITDSFEVRESVPFDVERVSATRIFPPNKYPMEILITANQDFQGTIADLVPGSFIIDNTPDSDYKFEQIQSISEEASQGVLGITTAKIGSPFSEEEPISLEFGQPLEHPELKILYKTFNLSGHDGVDFSVPIGTPVLAVDDGEVVLSGDGAYGTTVVIKHSWGKSYYGHLSEVKVTLDQNISKGQVIALSGNTGITTGPHLHFGIKLNGHNMRNGYFGKTDPLPILGIQSNLDPENQLKLITWKVSLKKGEKIKLSYTYKAPDVSPEFYKLGPLRLYENEQKIFEEGRQWQIASDAIGDKVVVASIPRSVLSLTTEQVGGTDAHVVLIDSPNQTPSYKYQFLTNGLRILVDKKDGAGFLSAVSQVQTAPEYMRRQGAPGNFVWNSYGLNINTAGSNVLQGFDKQDQPDGSVKLVKTYETFEEGVEEALTETWTIPKSAEKFAQKGPKAEYEMTKNRGIVQDGNIQEGTWRMRWAISGISDITSDSTDIKDSEGWPIRTKEYLNGLIKVDVNDFDNQFTTPMYTFSEVGANNKAEILFFKDGTTGDRIIDPTIVTENISDVWEIYSNHRPIFYNGSNFCVTYTKSTTDSFAKCASTIAGLASASEQTILTNQHWNQSPVDVFPVDDTKFDLAYTGAVATTCNSNLAFCVNTCTISGTTITCNKEFLHDPASGNTGGFNIVRTGSDRIWVVHTREGLSQGMETNIYSANETGDTDGLTGFTQEQSVATTFQRKAVLIPYESSDKVLAVWQNDPGGSNSDGLYYATCLQSDASCSSATRWLALTTPGDINVGNGFRISDTDFRYVYVDANGDVIEAKFDGSSTWTTAHATVHTGTDENPTMFYDRTGNQSYVLYEDSADDIFYHLKTCSSNSGCTESSWGAQVNADNDESDANTFPVTQMIEAPMDSSRTSPLEFMWCYRNANSTNFDIVCGSVNLAAADSGPTLDQIMRHGKWWNTSGVRQAFTF